VDRNAVKNISLFSNETSRGLGAHGQSYRDPKTLPTLFLTAPVSNWLPIPLNPMFHAIPVVHFSFAVNGLLEL